MSRRPRRNHSEPVRLSKSTADRTHGGGHRVSIWRRWAFDPIFADHNTVPKQPDDLLQLLESASPDATAWSATERCDTEWVDGVHRSRTVKAQFFDRQDAANRLNGVTLEDAGSLRRHHPLSEYCKNAIAI